MESIADSSERRSIASTHRKATKLTLFGDLLQPEYPNPATDTSGCHRDYSSSCPSDCESGISGNSDDPRQVRRFENGLIRVGNGEMIYHTINKQFVSSLSSCGFSSARVEAIHRMDFSDVMMRAKLQTFSIYTAAVEAKSNGNAANVKYAWYGASKHDIARIVSHGFGFPTNSPAFGQGVCLAPADHPIESIRSSVTDEDSVRHMLLCRVILGKAEVVNPSSGQHCPSSDEFDSGVDNLAFPNKYIVWSSSMNTHILPEFVVSFRASSSCTGCPKMPNSHWMPFGTLIAALSKFLPPNAAASIAKYHSDYKKKKIARYEMIQRVRRIAGDKLLLSIIKSHRAKK